MRKIGLLIILVLNLKAGFGQQVHATIRASYGQFFSATPRTGDWRFKVYSDASTFFCMKANNKPANQWVPLQNETVIQFPIFNNVAFDLNQDISIDVEAWQEDSFFSCTKLSACGMDDCGFNSGCPCGDTDHCAKTGPSKTFKLSDFPPGSVSTNTVDIQYCNYAVRYTIYYEIPSPVINITSSTPGFDPNGQLCNYDINLSATTISDAYQSLFHYQWDFNIDGETETVQVDNPAYCGNEFGVCESPDTNPSCCYEPPTIPQDQLLWRSIGTSDGSINGGVKSIFLSDLPGLENITVNTSINIRVILTLVSGPWLGVSIHDPTKISPLPPSITNIWTEAACPHGKDGIVHVVGVKGLGDYKYILRPGHDNIAECNPDMDGSCFSNTASGSASGIDFDITTNVVAGPATVWITNNGSNAGLCGTKTNIDVRSVADLILNPADKIDGSCHSSNDGKITLSSSGGKASYTYALNGTLKNGTSFNPSNATGVFQNLQAGTYTASVIDGCNQVTAATSNSVTVNEPKPIIADSELKDVTCNSPADGSITVTINDGPGTYNYNLLNYAGSSVSSSNSATETSWTPANLPAGTYTVEVQDAAHTSCDGYSAPVVLNGPPALNLVASNVIVDSVSCYNGSDGKITLNAVDLSGAYKYNLTQQSNQHVVSSTTNPLFDKLTTDDFALTIKRNAICNDFFDYPQPIKVLQPTAISNTLIGTDITCFEKHDGKITATVSGGTGSNYNKVWEFETASGWTDLGKSTLTVSGLFEGLYRLRVEDKKHCPATSNEVTIVEPSALVIDTAYIKDIKCFSEKGSITVVSSGGTPSYTFEYSTDNGISFNTFDGSTPFDAGTYIVRVKDKNQCVVNNNDPQIITSPLAALSFSSVQSDYNGFNISCFGGNNGTVTITASGGNGSIYSGYSYRLDNKSFPTQNFIPGITPGDHQIAVQDGRGCVQTKIINFTQAPKLQTITTFKQDVNCFGDSTGILELKVTGGLGTFGYQLGGSKPQSSPRFEGLRAADYAFNIIDSNRCSTVYNDKIVNLYPTITSSSTIHNTSCYQGNDGSIDLTVNGGASSAYTYELENFGTTLNPVPHLASGTYKVTISDSKGCKHIIEDLKVGQPPELRVDSVTYNDIVCLGEKGTIQVKSNGGTLPYEYQYSIDNDGNYSPFTSTTPLSASNYTLRVRDSHNCFSLYNKTVSITNPSASLDFTYQLSDYNGFNISCFGADNGFITVNGQGGNGANYAGYQIAVDTSPYQDNSTFNHINAGQHRIYVRDARGCVVNKNITFTQSQNLLTGSLLSQENVSCFYERNGTLEVAVNGGISPYKYWLTTQNKQSSPTFSGLGAGDYTVTIQDVNACEVKVLASIKSIHPEFFLSFDVHDVNCFNGQDGTINLSVTGGVPPFQYQWKNQQSISNTLQNVKSGAYEVTVTDGANCFATKSVLVNQPLAPLQIGSISTNTACYDQSNGAINIQVSGGTTPYQYSIDNGKTYLTQASINSAVGTFLVVVKDNQGCTANGSATVTQRNDRPEPNFLASSRQNALDTLILTDISIPKPDSIHWTFAPNTTVINANPWAPEIEIKTEGTYSVTMTGYYGDCAYDVTKNIFLKPFDANHTDEKLPGVRAIESMDVTPNPTTGEFTVTVKLNKKRNLSIIVYNTLGYNIFQSNYEEIDSLDQHIDITSSAAGLYLVRAITESDARDVRIIVKP